MKILAIDYGLKRVGLAIADTEINLALPAGVLKVVSQAELLTQIKNKISAEQIDKLIIGDPVPLLGGVSEQTRQVREFTQHLQAVLTVPVELFDERLTSRRADAAKQTGAKVHSRDELAAMYLLTDYLENQQTPKS